MFRLLSQVKRLFVSPGKAPRVVKYGLFKGITMNLDLSYQSQLYLGLFEREANGPLRQMAAQIQTAIDIGAGEGEYALYFLKTTRAEKVFAFEPDPIARERLQDNLRLNEVGDRRLQLSSAMVGSQNGDDWCSLDTLIPAVKTPCLVKVDVDGGEVEILQGATEFLKMTEIGWLIETHSEALESECIHILRRAGYNIAIIPNAWWRRLVPELRAIPHNRWLAAVKR